MNPVVSVVIPTFNRERYIRETVESVLAQSYRGIEVVVVDDGSTDGTRDIVRGLCGADSRVKYVWQENAERAAARNTGIRTARASYVAFLDSDDLWSPSKIELQLGLLEQDPDMVMAVSWYETIDERGEKIAECKSPTLAEAASGNFWGLLAQSNRIGSPCPVVKREVFERAGMFSEDPALICFGEDWEMWTRIACFGTVGVVPKILAQHRIHRGNTEKPLDASSYLKVTENVMRHVPNDKADGVSTIASQRYWALLCEAPPATFGQRIRDGFRGINVFRMDFVRASLLGNVPDFVKFLAGIKACSKIRALLTVLRVLSSKQSGSRG